MTLPSAHPHPGPEPDPTPTGEARPPDHDPGPPRDEDGGPRLTRAQLRAARGGRRGRRGRKAGDGVSGRVRWWRRVTLSLVVVLLVTLAAVVRVTALSPRVEVTALPSETVVAPGTAPVLPWPATGEAAVSIPAVGFSAQSGPEAPVPVASLTKMMTAWVILRDHPLAYGGEGPAITMTVTDVQDYVFGNATDQAGVAVSVGEVLSERQVLEGLLVHSANNLADTLARWDAGSIPAFVAKMNAAARAFGMSHTTFADAAGIDPGSKSTARDLLTVAAALMSNPTFAAIADMPSVTLPVAGLLYSYTPLIGTRGVVGLKSGFTEAAGGCDVLALMSTVAGRPVMVLVAVTGQDGPDVLAQAGSSALAIAQVAVSGVRPVRAVSRGQVVGIASAYGARVRVVANAPASVLAWAGRSVVASLQVTDPPVGGAKVGTVIGDSVVEARHQRVAVPVRLAGDLPAPSLAQRLF